MSQSNLVQVKLLLIFVSKSQHNDQSKSQGIEHLLSHRFCQYISFNAIHSRHIKINFIKLDVVIYSDDILIQYWWADKKVKSYYYMWWNTSTVYDKANQKPTSTFGHKPPVMISISVTVTHFSIYLRYIINCFLILYLYQLLCHPYKSWNSPLGII